VCSRSCLLLWVMARDACWRWRSLPGTILCCEVPSTGKSTGNSAFVARPKRTEEKAWFEADRRVKDAGDEQGAGLARI
jgi:hypothetical protein